VKKLALFALKMAAVAASVVVVAALAVSSLPPKPASREVLGREIPTEVIEPYVVAAGYLSGYTIPAERPRVLLVKDPKFFQEEGGCNDAPDCITYGLYDINPDAPDVIFLNFDMPVEVREATIVHELVHWLQEKNGVSFETCAERTHVEHEAYMIDYVYTVLYIDRTAKLDLPEGLCE
jgi:hypothetical protein